MVLKAPSQLTRVTRCIQWALQSTIGLGRICRVWDLRNDEPPDPFAGQPRRAAPLDQLAAGLLLLREEPGRVDAGRRDFYVLRRHLARDGLALEHHRALDHRDQGQGARRERLQPRSTAE